MTTIRPAFTRKARVEIIPLIDVIFFLLATFVLFTLSQNRIGSIPLTLPSPGISDPPPPTPLFIHITRDGALFWDSEAITAVELAPRLADYKRSNTDPRIMIAGDTSAQFDAAVGVLDEVRLAGIERVSIATQPRATP